MWYSKMMNRMRDYCKEGIITDTTSNYNFSLPDYTDTMDVKVLDDNFTAIDEQLNTLETDKADKATYAPINSPTFTGTPTAPTVGPYAQNTQIATTEFVWAALQVALSSTEYAKMYANISAYSTISDLTSSEAKITYTEFQNGGGELYKPVYKDVRYLTSTSEPIFSSQPVFFRSVAWKNDDEGFNDQYLLYDSGRVYKRERQIWDYLKGTMNGDFGDWEQVTSPEYSIFTD